mmetsp:Transcript_863/g.1808  ORF Transcript_863/g.1808 Transcript_863/m.1808 type:complete len:342 (-) Transcript_863:1500-2525(-)
MPDAKPVAGSRAARGGFAVAVAHVQLLARAYVQARQVGVPHFVVLSASPAQRASVPRRRPHRFRAFRLPRGGAAGVRVPEVPVVRRREVHERDPAEDRVFARAPHRAADQRHEAHLRQHPQVRPRLAVAAVGGGSRVAVADVQPPNVQDAKSLDVVLLGAAGRAGGIVVVVGAVAQPHRVRSVPVVAQARNGSLCAGGDVEKGGGGAALSGVVPDAALRIGRGTGRLRRGRVHCPVYAVVGFSAEQRRPGHFRDGPRQHHQVPAGSFVADGEGNQALGPVRRRLPWVLAHSGAPAVPRLVLEAVVRHAAAGHALHDDRVRQPEAHDVVRPRAREDPVRCVA